MDGSKIMTQSQPSGIPGGLLFGMIAASGLWLLTVELRHLL